MGLVWRELPTGPAEPPLLCLVRDRQPFRWLRTEQGWELLDGEHAGCVMGWDHVSRLGPLHLAEDPDSYAPFSPPGEVLSTFPSDYDIRESALEAAAHFAGKRPVDWTPEAVVEAARVFEPYLREG